MKLTNNETKWDYQASKHSWKALKSVLTGSYVWHH